MTRSRICAFARVKRSAAAVTTAAAVVKKEAWAPGMIGIRMSSKVEVEVDRNIDKLEKIKPVYQIRIRTQTEYEYE